jgi:hypothetical protein
VGCSGEEDKNLIGSRVQKFKGSRVQGFKSSRVQKFRGSRFKGSQFKVHGTGRAVQRVALHGLWFSQVNLNDGTLIDEV